MNTKCLLDKYLLKSYFVFYYCLSAGYMLMNKAKREPQYIRKQIIINCLYFCEGDDQDTWDQEVFGQGDQKELSEEQFI